VVFFRGFAHTRPLPSDLVSENLPRPTNNLARRRR
jgi:hypothetical protein